MALPTPVGRQREVVYLPAEGHQVVLGTAGSGKTSMAILRAAYLSTPDLPLGGRTLFITFNKTLSSYIRYLASGIIARVTVENYHLFARGYLNSRGRMPQSAIMPSTKQTGLIEAAVSEVSGQFGNHAFFDRPLTFFGDELQWLSRHGMRSDADYYSVTRTGRADAQLPRSFRPAMWQIAVAYRRLRTEAGHLYDLDDIAMAVFDELRRDTSKRRYSHVVIDEGQDLSPEMLRSLSHVVPQSGSVTFFGDVAQQIYGHRMSWRSAGLNPIKVWHFEENYRNTREIANLALAIAKMPYYAGSADMVAPREPAAAGAKPTLVSFSDESAELNFAVERATRFGATRSVAILVRTREQVGRFRSRLAGCVRILKGELGGWQGGPGISCGTYHSGKGLEFDVVILPFLSAAAMPLPAAIEASDIDEASAVDGRLLYVGVTRAKTDLLLSFTRQPTELLPKRKDLYVELVR